MAPQLPSKKRTFRRLKQFRCEGYGDCNMVFSRSEHLARHIRKHTGEKPFKCDHPDCTKQFSRFDNMRQHAQTHSKAKPPTPAHTTSGHDDIRIRPKPHHQPFLQPSSSSPKRRKDSALGEASDRFPKTQGTSINNKNNNNSQNGLISPVSLSGTFDDASQRKKQDLDTLTQDELDALDALNQFRQSPSDGPLV